MLDEARASARRRSTISRTINAAEGAAIPHESQSAALEVQRDGFRRGQGVRCSRPLSETATPPLLKSDNGAAAKGAFWIDPASGRVVRTQLDFETSRQVTVSATIRVDYAYRQE